MGHDVTRLGAAAVKRRYPPGMVPGQLNEEITLVQSDIEGSTEIWEWYAALPLPSHLLSCIAALEPALASSCTCSQCPCSHLLQTVQLAAACVTASLQCFVLDF